MQKRFRKYYFWSIFTVFFICAPLIILYTSGYRIDWQKKQLVETGSFYFKTQPKQADVFIDQELYKDKTPILVNNLLPDEYKVVLSKEGYQSWEKKLKIESGSTNFAQEVILFKKTLPEIIEDYPTDLKEDEIEEIKIDFDMDVKGYSWDEDQENLLYYNDFEIWTYKLEEQKKDLITRQSSMIQEVIWHPLGSYLIYVDEQGIKAIELDQRDTTQIYLLTDLKGTNLKIGNKGNYLYFQAENKKYSLELY